MTRFSDKSYVEENKVPKIVTLPVVLQNRTIASIAPIKDKKDHYNNKQLYFYSINHQLHKIAELLKINKVSTADRCPYFHSINKTVVDSYAKSLIDDKNLIPSNKRYLKSTQQPAFFPELHLPLSENKNGKTVFDYAKQETGNFDYQGSLKKALAIHLKKTQKEVIELCDTGSSSNYYIYENLVTLANTSPLTPNKTNLETILKITIFTNQFLINSLEEKKKTPLIDPALSRVGSTWFSNYVSTIISKREK